MVTNPIPAQKLQNNQTTIAGIYKKENNIMQDFSWKTTV